MTQKLASLKKVTKLWQASFVLVILSFLFVIGGSILAPDEATLLPESGLTKLGFFVAFTLVAILVVNGFFLWISMLVFLVRFDGRSTGKRAVWFAVVLFGLCYGAAAYYFVSVRPKLAAHS